ncbi:uncharacterized protein LOC111707276 isoform X2 [Eurytemora carolleeae]|uniref:uncharacterized protein LOC111707276 isoform X2 n=1 Tax=Eurytemora carolleeae TaxID=1294199 RepID=UPI000C77674D|nr:uncharacterized protein LOC111707276 isoform X2 [Eurytemora carolleeae]|eukprot:XP_023336121.1 uncharacterized protein LOC111707276 isoform X2 [Eurytemora affinis]
MNTKCPTRSLLFVRTPTDLISPLVSPSVRFSFEDAEWKTMKKSSLKKPRIQSMSTPSKQKKVRFDNVAEQMFYPVAQFYNEGFLVTDKEITRQGLFLILSISLGLVVSGSLAYCAGMYMVASILGFISFLLVLAVLGVVLGNIFKKKDVIKVRKQRLGP